MTRWPRMRGKAWVQHVDDIAALCQSGVAHLRSNRLAEAERDFLHVTARHPNHVPGLLALGAIALQQRRPAVALSHAQRLVALAPAVAAHHLLLGRVLRDLGRPAEALAPFRTALRRDPADTAVRFELAALLADSGAPEEAVLCYRAALRREPGFAAGHYNLGNLLAGLGRAAEAVPCYQAALALQPGDPLSRNNLAGAYRRMGRLDEAAACYMALAEQHPGMVEAHDNLGIVLFEQGLFAEAAASFRRALQVQPGHADALNHLGSALLEMGEPGAAEQCLREAVARQPDHPGPHNNLGAALRDSGQVREAEICFARALQLAPGHVQARYNLATTMLLTGQMADGWPLYEVRWQTTTMTPRGFPQPQWRGEALGDQMLLLHAEQGLGDTLQFCRFVAQVARSTRVVLEVHPPLQHLIRRALPGVERIVARGEALPAFTRHCPLISLPMILGTTLDTIPTAPYLAPESAEARRWQERLGALPGLRVGLVWRGSQVHAEMRRMRDMPAAQLAALRDIDGVSFVSLQKDLPPAAQAEVAAILPMHDWTAELADFDQTAALVAGLDLVIGVDTAVIHLAGALGRPVWLLNRHNTCWRWLLDRDDSPWYPSLRMFRQATPGDWAGPMTHVRSALAELAARRTG